MPSAPDKPLQRRHIAALVAVGDHRSVHRAAREMGVPQPVLSRLLAEAEGLLGARLFERSSHGSTPTAKGIAVLSQARFVLRAMERLHDAATQSPRQPIRLGCIPRVMHTLLPGLFGKLYPAAPTEGSPQQFQVIEGSSRALFEQLAAGKLDFAIVRSAAQRAGDQDDLVLERLYQERTVIICAAGHPGIPDRTVPLSSLGEQNWALPDGETSSRIAFDEFWYEHGLPRIRPVIETRSFESSLALVAGTSLISIAPEAVARRHVEFGLLRIVKARQPIPADPVVLAFASIAQEDPVLEGFRGMIHDAARAVRELSQQAA